MASGPEKIEERLRKGKITDTPSGDVQILLEHELLKGLVSNNPRTGSHAYIVKVPYQALRKYAKELAAELKNDKIPPMINKDGFPIVIESGRSVKSHYVKDLLDFLEVRRVLQEAGF